LALREDGRVAYQHERVKVVVVGEKWAMTTLEARGEDPHGQ